MWHLTHFFLVLSICIQGSLNSFLTKIWTSAQDLTLVVKSWNVVSAFCCITLRKNNFIDFLFMLKTCSGFHQSRWFHSLYYSEWVATSLSNTGFLLNDRAPNPSSTCFQYKKVVSIQRNLFLYSDSMWVRRLETAVPPTLILIVHPGVCLT